jgi:hypothetical protein
MLPIGDQPSFHEASPRSMIGSQARHSSLEVIAEQT